MKGVAFSICKYHPVSRRNPCATKRTFAVRPSATMTSPVRSTEWYVILAAGYDSIVLAKCIKASFTSRVTLFEFAVLFLLGVFDFASWTTATIEYWGVIYVHLF